MRVDATLPTDPHAAPDPLPGHPIDVVIPGGWRLPVQCHEATAPGDVLLQPFGEEVILPGGTELPASLEWRSARGLVRREGVLRQAANGFILSQAADAVVMQRRNFARVRAQVRVAIPGHDLLTNTVDISAGGMLLENAATLEIGETVRFSIGLPDQMDLQASGEVVRATSFGHRAIQFDPLPRNDEQRLTRFVFQQEREGRSVAAYARG